METLACAEFVLLVSAFLFASNAPWEMQLDRLEARGSGRKVSDLGFDRLEARGSGRNIVRPVLA